MIVRRRGKTIRSGIAKSRTIRSGKNESRNTESKITGRITCSNVTYCSALTSSFLKVMTMWSELYATTNARTKCICVVMLAGAHGAISLVV